MTLPLSTPRVLAAGALDIARSTQAQAHNELCSATIQVTNVHARRPLETRRVSPQICSCTDKNRYFTRSADPGLLRCLRESRGSKDIITDSGCASALNRNKCIIQQQTMHCKQEHTHEQNKNVFVPLGSCPLCSVSSLCSSIFPFFISLIFLSCSHFPFILVQQKDLIKFVASTTNSRSTRVCAASFTANPPCPPTHCCSVYQQCLSIGHTHSSDIQC